MNQLNLLAIVLAIGAIESILCMKTFLDNSVFKEQDDYEAI